MADMPPLPMPSTSLRLPLLAAAAVALAFFVGFGGWAATAPLASAALAPATVAPDGSRKTVQHLEGGIVREILVRDGSQVAAGQPLLLLDDTRARAEHAALLADWQALKAAETRLLAEQAGAAALAIPPALRETAAGGARLAGILAGEQERLTSRRAALDGQKAVLAERIAQAEAEIAGLEAEILSGQPQLGLIEEEVAVVQSLLRRGLERARAEIEGDIGADQAVIAHPRQVIAETRQQRRALESEAAERAADELAEVRRDLASTEEKLRATADRLARTRVAASLAGTVVRLKVKTRGGVVAAGEPLLDLVPADADLLLEARVAPVDIDEVHAGLEAQIHLLAYKSRNPPRIAGEVHAISADRLEDPHTRQPYYLARVAVARVDLPAGIALAPGMPAEVLIVTGERTLLDYLLRPLADTLRRGLRES